ncbi:hypothetical protein VNI00_010005 [Paramarasmius palmivorus]|uniref:F-box domain-containing protein n=1 Tax=Paramarasmius palmivorus TaxID=297713 RepID=A0AAW0CMD7_9AGAR
MPGSPISRLPNDILYHIFVICMRNALSSGSYTDRIHLKKRRTWIRVTHVCQRWRSIALNCASLWNTPHFEIPELAATMLNRAKSTPLYLEANLTDSFAPFPVLEGACNDISRIAGLRISARTHELNQLLSGKTQPAPLLEYLEICSLSVIFRYNLPENLFKSETPRLRELALVGCNFDTSMFQCHKLTKLIVRTGDSASMKGLPEALESMPHLYHLELEGNLPSMITVRQDLEINLPRLSCIRLRGLFVDCAGLLHCINIPATAAVSVVGIVRTPDLSQVLVACVSRLFYQSTPLSADRVIKELTLDTTRLTPAHPRFTFTASDLRSGQEPSVSIRLVDCPAIYSMPNVKADLLARSILAILPLIHLQDLQLSVNGGFDAKHYSEYFGSLDKLQNIRVGGKSAPEFVASISQNYPALKSVAFHDVDYGVYNFMNALTGSLKRRSDEGRAVERFEVKKSRNFTENEAKLLKALVGTLDWDCAECKEEWDFDVEREFWTSLIG